MSLKFEANIGWCSENKWALCIVNDCWRQHYAYQNGLHNLQGPVQDENAGPHVQKAEEKYTKGTKISRLFLSSAVSLSACHGVAHLPFSVVIDLPDEQRLYSLAERAKAGLSQRPPFVNCDMFWASLGSPEVQHMDGSSQSWKRNEGMFPGLGSLCSGPQGERLPRLTQHQPTMAGEPSALAQTHMMTQRKLTGWVQVPSPSKTNPCTHRGSTVTRSF